MDTSLLPLPHPLTCQLPVVHDTDHRNWLVHQVAVAWRQLLNSSPTTTWELRKLLAPRSSCPSILFDQKVPHRLSLKERRPLCYMWKVKKMEMNHCLSLSNVIIYQNVFRPLLYMTMKGLATAKWNSTKPLMAYLTINNDTLLEYEKSPPPKKIKRNKRRH